MQYSEVNINIDPLALEHLEEITHGIAINIVALSDDLTDDLT